MHRRETMILCLLAVCLILVSGCDQKAMFQKRVPSEPDAFAKEYLQALKEGDGEKVLKLFDPRAATPGTPTNLRAVSAFLRQDEMLSLETIAWRALRIGEETQTQLTYQMQFPKGWAVAQVAVATVGEESRIAAIRVNAIAKPLGEINAFTLSGKTVRHYVILVIAACVPIFMGYALVMCIVGRIRLKLLWILFILVGFGKCSLDWTTGAVGFKPLALQLFGASMIRHGLYAPWIISVSLPLGAILFMILRGRLVRSAGGAPARKAADAG